MMKLVLPGSLSEPRNDSLRKEPDTLNKAKQGLKADSERARKKHLQEREMAQKKLKDMTQRYKNKTMELHRLRNSLIRTWSLDSAEDQPGALSNDRLIDFAQTMAKNYNEMVLRFDTLSGLFEAILGQDSKNPILSFQKVKRKFDNVLQKYNKHVEVCEKDEIKYVAANL